MTTRPRATTHPLPSCDRSQAGASPLTLTMLRAAASTPAVRTTAGSGGSTARIRSGPKPSNTRGNPWVSSRVRNPANTRPLLEGITLSMALTIRERPMARDRVCADPPRSAPAISDTRMQTATTLATAPRAASSSRAGRLRTWLRARVPNATPTACPMLAAASTPTTITTTRRRSAVSGVIQRSSSRGSPHIASAPPPRNPVSDSMLTTTPCRNPETA